MHIADPVREALIVLGAAAIVIPLFHRLRISPVIGYILVGLLAGPAGLGALADRLPILAAITITDRERLAPLAEFGVVFLLFMIGLEMSWQRIRGLRRLVLGLGAAQVAVCAAAIAGVAFLVTADPRAAAVTGIALAMSSTAVVTQVLADSGRMTTRVGRASFAVLLFQDLAVLPVLFALGVLGNGDVGGPLAILLAVGQAVATVAVLVAVGRLLLRPLFRGVARAGSPELFMAACLLVVLATGVAATAAGLSASLGALIAGLLLAETEYRRQIEITVEPFKGLLLGVFLISVGLNLDLGGILAHPVPVLAAAIGLVALKATLTAILARLFRVRWPVAVQAGLLLGPGGEFGFVILGLGAATGLIPASLAASAFLLAALTMAAIPGLAWLGQTLAALEPAPPPPELLPPPSDPDEAAVIIAGFGRVGRTVATLLEQHAIPYLALDADIGRVARHRRAGVAVYYGDVTRTELLTRVGLATARALVVTIDDRARADAVVAAARAARPDLLIVVRARDAAHAAHLYRLGATDAVPETIEASLQLSEAVLVDLGVPMGPVLVSIHEQRALFQSEIKAMVPHVDIRPRGQLRLRAGPVASPPAAP